uniref:Uncharacterized protein n=2 Tax=Physcomitrium patens TaxID=3218 RepID=A0A2K1IEG9_PHYPA|nr:hypothetical protein PHYPA_029824 [Physcomitrium patens]
MTQQVLSTESVSLRLSNLAVDRVRFQPAAVTDTLHKLLLVSSVPTVV